MVAVLDALTVFAIRSDTHTNRTAKSTETTEGGIMMTDVEVTFECVCGKMYSMLWEELESCLYHSRVEGLASDCCNYTPNVNYGGMEA